MENKSIYNIQKDHLDLMYTIESNEGEITPEIDQALSITKDQLESKAVSYGYLMKSLENDSSILQQEIDRLSSIKSQKDKLQFELKQRLVFAMEIFNIDKISKDNLTLSFKKSKQTEVLPDAILPLKYIKSKKVESIDKTLLKKDLESGIIVLGASIKEINNLQIK